MGEGKDDSILVMISENLLIFQISSPRAFDHKESGNVV